MIRGTAIERVCENCGLRSTMLPVSEPMCPSCGFQKKVSTEVQSLMGALELRYTEAKGLGVFTNKPIQIAELIEAAPALLWIDAEIQLEGLRSWEIEMRVSKTQTDALSHYLLPWMTRGTALGPRAFVLGYGMVYNHSENPNAAWTYREDADGRYWMDFYALRDIEADCEITVSYAPSKRSLWFTPYD